jgi:hypothetical protein
MIGQQDIGGSRLQKPKTAEVAEFLAHLLRDGRLHPADIEILKAHAGLGERGGENWEITEAASRGIVEQWSQGLTQEVKDGIDPWSQPPSWHVADCLQRWLGYAIAQEFPYYARQINSRKDGTKRWWQALGEQVEVIGDKCIRVKLRTEIIEALNLLERNR